LHKYLQNECCTKSSSCHFCCSHHVILFGECRGKSENQIHEGTIPIYVQAKWKQHRYKWCTSLLPWVIDMRVRVLRYIKKSNQAYNKLQAKQLVSLWRRIPMRIDRKYVWSKGLRIPLPRTRKESAYVRIPPQPIPRKIEWHVFRKIAITKSTFIENYSWNMLFLSFIKRNDLEWLVLFQKKNVFYLRFPFCHSLFWYNSSNITYVRSQTS